MGCGEAGGILLNIEHLNDFLGQKFAPYNRQKNIYF